MHCYPEIKKNKHYADFVKLFEDKPSNIEVQKTDNITDHDFKHLINNTSQEHKKFNVFNVGMGAGKTEKTIEFLKHCDNFLWITPNIALSANAQTRIDNELMQAL